MDPMKIGIVGTGLRAAGFCHYAKENSEKVIISALSDINIEKAKFQNDHFGLKAKLYNDFKELISDDEVEAVL